MKITNTTNLALEARLDTLIDYFLALIIFTATQLQKVFMTLLRLTLRAY